MGGGLRGSRGGCGGSRPRRSWEKLRGGRLQVARAIGAAPSRGCGSGRCALGPCARRRVRRGAAGAPGEGEAEVGVGGAVLGMGGPPAAPSSRLCRVSRQVGRTEAAPAFPGPGVEGARPAENAVPQGREGALRPEKPGLAGRRVTPRGRAVGTRGRQGGATQPAALFLDTSWVPGHSSSPAPSVCPERSSLGHAGLGQWGLGLRRNRTPIPPRSQRRLG